MTLSGYAQWVDDNSLVHLGPDDVTWDTYTICSTSGYALRTRSMFKLVGANVVLTCLQCIAKVDAL